MQKCSQRFLLLFSYEQVYLKHFLAVHFLKIKYFKDIISVIDVSS